MTSRPVPDRLRRTDPPVPDPLRRLAGRPRPGLFLGALVVVLVALFLPGTIGAVLVGLIVLAMAWLMSLTWSVTPPRTRVLRLAILLILAVITWYKATH